MFLRELGEYDRALEIYKGLVTRNPDNSNFYDAVIRLHNMTKTDLDDVLQFYDEYAEAHPKADVPRRVPLLIATGTEAVEISAQNFRNPQSCRTSIKTLNRREKNV